ncbi:hypothetical protein JL721_5897 [Aureococcus anophagefferens]|nr:hypothetical protein JL721_5897 [Aureococcus anophagefferens]
MTMTTEDLHGMLSVFGPIKLRDGAFAIGYTERSVATMLLRESRAFVEEQHVDGKPVSNTDMFRHTSRATLAAEKAAAARRLARVKDRAASIRLHVKSQERAVLDRVRASAGRPCPSAAAAAPGPSTRSRTTTGTAPRRRRSDAERRVARGNDDVIEVTFIDGPESSF